MGPHDLLCVIRRSALATVITGLLLDVTAGREIALGFIFGGLWCACNLWTLKGLIESISSRRTVRLVIFVQIKLLLLYGLGGLILYAVPLSIPAALAGFHVPLIGAGAASFRSHHSTQPGRPSGKP